MTAPRQIDIKRLLTLAERGPSTDDGTLFSLSEMVNVNRKVEDDDEQGARQALDDLPELAIGAHEKRPSTKSKLDLDLAAGGGARADRRRADLSRMGLAPAGAPPRPLPGVRRARLGGGGGLVPRRGDAAAHRPSRRQFEAPRPKRRLIHGEPKGDELDLSALVRDVAERRRGPSALLAPTHGLTACGDEHAIHTFTSRRRSRVDVSTVNDFDEPLGLKVVRRIEALRPGQHTCIGAAVRHVTAQLAERPYRHRLMLILTDGKPNDIDHYEGRYGIEDTRMAIRAAREAGLSVFGVTVEEHAQDYFPYIFGQGTYAIFPNITRLPAALPAIYRQIAA